MNIQFAKVLRKYRREKDLTQEEFAHEIGISPQSISKWERGDGFPDISLLPAIANFFGISIDTLLGNDEESKRADIKQFWESAGSKQTIKEKVELALLYDKKYPDRYYIANYLVMTIMCLPQEECAQYLPALTRTCEKILKNCTVERYRRRALESMCTVCPEEEFEKYYKLCPQVYIQRLEVLEKRLWEQGKRTESNAAHQASDLILTLHALLRPGRYDREPEKMLAWCQERIKLIEFLAKNDEIPQFIYGAYAFFHLRAACALFGCGRKEEGYDCLEKSLDLLEDARRKDVDQKIISLDGDPRFGQLKIDCIFRRSCAPRPLILCMDSAETVQGFRTDCA